MIKVYTDGSCLENPGKGGWAAIIINDNKKTEIKGSKENSTNNQMELTAPIMALKKIPKGSKVQIFTDSKYVKSGITEWIQNWKKLYIDCIKNCKYIVLETNNHIEGIPQLELFRYYNCIIDKISNSSDDDTTNNHGRKTYLISTNT